MPELKQTDRRVRRRDPAHRRQVSALNPPQNAEAANTKLAQGLHDIAAGTRAASAKIANLKSVGAAIAYLEHSKGPVKGSREVTKALADAAEARLHDRQLSSPRLETGPSGGQTAHMVSAAAARKTVSVLFCDLADSTVLGERLDPEPLRELLGAWYEEMRIAVERHGGTVEKFIGDAVMAVFGLPRVHEDDALRAVRAALDMQRAVERMNASLEARQVPELRIRIGINTGEVVTGDDAATLATGRRGQHRETARGGSRGRRDPDRRGHASGSSAMPSRLEPLDAVSRRRARALPSRPGACSTPSPAPIRSPAAGTRRSSGGRASSRSFETS